LDSPDVHRGNDKYPPLFAFNINIKNIKFKRLFEFNILFMEVVEKELKVDGDGFLLDPYIWNEEVAETFAKIDGIEVLTEKHWAIIKLIRKNWEEKGMAPMVRTICQTTGIRLKEIYQLFPLGPARGACRVAGLPKPDGCV
jgi:TusE/DsrC/DsvC family sulfur relay protein